ncbi:MAG TPA: hypothetical protein VK064_03005 [Wenzhouxiangella sp.]|nr:hypothetical protein [Wenzhouxiangella sp.]
MNHCSLQMNTQPTFPLPAEKRVFVRQKAALARPLFKQMVEAAGLYAAWLVDSLFLLSVPVVKNIEDRLRHQREAMLLHSCSPSCRFLPSPGHCQDASMLNPCACMRAACCCCTAGTGVMRNSA